MIFRQILTRSATASIVTAAVAAAGVAVTSAPSVSASANVFYVSCNGDDGNTGRSASKPWRTLKHASAAPLEPGGKLLLERGCTWTGERLEPGWTGTAAAPIVISNYGSGERPLIRDGKNSNVKITGRHLVIRGLRSHFRPMNQLPCGQSIGNVYGFNLTGGAKHVLITNSESSGATAGIHLSKNSGNNRIIDNHLHHNNVMTSFGDNPALDLGVWGILVRSDHNEIADNLITDNVATCRNQGYKLMSNSVEVYEGSYNYIHHNRSVGDRVFSELGSSATKKATGNIYEFNIFDTDLVDSRFVTTRGSDDQYGPVRSTRVLHNTTYQTGPGSQGVVCGGKCTAGILELRNNILFAREKAIYVKGTAEFGPNLVYGGSGREFVQIVSQAGRDAAEGQVVVANPKFRNADNGNLRLKSGSAAISAADDTRESTIGDFARNDVRGPGPELGAFEL